MLYFYFVTLSIRTVERLTSSIRKQREVDIIENNTEIYRRILVCDNANYGLSEEIKEFFNGGIEECDPYIIGDDGLGHFNMSRLRNLAISSARLSDEQWMYFCDADTIILKHSYPTDINAVSIPNVYWQENTEEDILTSIENISTRGNAAFSDANSWFIIPRAVFEKFDFNEKMYGYGYEDIDFYLRLNKCGISFKKIDGIVIHNAHEHSERNIIDWIMTRNRAIAEAASLVYTWNVEPNWRESLVLNVKFRGEIQYLVYYKDIMALVDVAKGWVSPAILNNSVIEVRDCNKCVERAYGKIDGVGWVPLLV